MFNFNQDIFSSSLGCKGSKIRLLEALDFLRLAYFQWDRCSGASTAETLVTWTWAGAFTCLCPLRLTTGLRRTARVWEFILQGLPRSSPPLYIYREPISEKQHGLCLFPVVRTASFERHLLLWHQSWTAVHGRAASWLQRAWDISQSRRSNSCNKSLSWGSRSLRGLKRNRFLKALFGFQKYQHFMKCISEHQRSNMQGIPWSI